MLVGFTALLCVLLGAGPGVAIVCVLVSLVIAGAIVTVSRARRARSVESLRRSAAQTLAADLPSQIESAPEPSGDDLDRMPEDLGPLAAAVTELRERMRVQLKEKAKKTRNLEALIDALDEPLLVTDNEDRVLLCSRSAEAILDNRAAGLTGVLGRPISELFTNAEILGMHDAAKAGQTLRGRVRVVTPIGARAFQVSASPLPAAWGEGVFGAVLTLRDVTELDQAVQVKTDFVANASHELRTPVAAIRSAAETLETAADDPAMSARLRQMIIAHAERLEEMLRDLLDLSRLESPDVPLKIETLSLTEIERLLRSMSEPACAERRLGVSFEIDEEMRLIRTDRKLLTLILRNLVENATKFAHEETTIRIVGQVIEEVIPRGDAHGEAGRSGVVRFEVIDKGVGIPLAQQERVFERYYQVDSARTGTGSGGQGGWKRGTGLGLAIVKHAAKALGGRTGLSSVWGQGTTAWVEFPCALVAAATPAPHAPPIPPIPSPIPRDTGTPA
jgi:two-component system, OmpR family, phosphate regulon sensor histidine kinase PhoR